MIETRHDFERGCGWRKPGGLYLIAGGPSESCGRLPLAIPPCPTCSAGLKPSRGWTWVDADHLFANAAAGCGGGGCGACPFGRPLGRVGLLWIGEQFYPTPQDFLRESRLQGISRRISTVPRDLVLGETAVLLAHRKAIRNTDGTFTPGIVSLFYPKALEYVVKGDETEEQLEALHKRGIIPVRVEKRTDLFAAAGGGA